MKRFLSASLAMLLAFSALGPVPALAATTAGTLVTIQNDEHHTTTSTPEPTPTPVPEPTPTPSPTMSPDPTMTECEMHAAMHPDGTMPTGEDHHAHLGEDPAHVMRIPADDLIPMAVASSKSVFATGTVPAAVLVDAYSPYNSMAAASLAGALKAPVLATQATSLHWTVRSELKRLGTRRVYVVGRSISSAVTTKLTASGFAVSRVSTWNDASRYATAASVARRTAAALKVAAMDTAFIVNGDSPWDAVAVSALAYKQKFPVLLVNSKGVPAVTAKAIRDLHVRKLVVVGSSTAIPGAVYSALKPLSHGWDTRIWGTSRYSLNVSVSRYAIKYGWAGPGHIVAANGVRSYLDGLVGAAHAGANDSLMLLTSTESLPAGTETFISENELRIGHFVVLGSASRVSGIVFSEVAGVLSR